MAKPDWLDELHVDFEDRFRGTREEIKQRLNAFLPMVREHGVATCDRPALDLGCGRGEWLELLRDNGLVARGVESNKTAAHLCRAAGLEVTSGDVAEYLRRVPDASLGLVTAFRLLGRSELPQLADLLTEIQRVLQPGAMVIFVNPDPESLSVGAGNFGMDNGHLHEPSRLTFLLERCGFTDLELDRASPRQPGSELELLDLREPLAGKLNPVIELLNARLGPPASTTVIGRKPAGLVSG